MKNLQEFAMVDDIEVLVTPGDMSNEPRLFMKDGKKNVCITVNSNEYENRIGEFFINDAMSEVYQEKAFKVMNALSCETEDLEVFTMFTLNDEYHEKLMEMVRETRNID